VVVIADDEATQLAHDSFDGGVPLLAHSATLPAGAADGPAPLTAPRR
jgi:hypothetical protein